MEMQEDTRPNILHLIEEGFEVFDAEGKKIGQVKSILFPSAYVEPNPADIPAIADHDSVPEDLMLKLLNSGFIQVSIGWLAKDRIVPLDQIEGVTGESIYLTEKYIDLMTF